MPEKTSKFFRFEPEGEDWYKETTFYLLDINGIVKFGITTNFEKRLKAYKKEVEDVSLVLIKNELYDSRWKAELLEQIIRWRLAPWSIYGREEWIDAPIQMVLECYHETRNTLMKEFDKYRYIHKTGKDRFDHYRQITEMIFDRQ